VTGSTGMPVTFTVSVGIAASARGGDLPSLLARADLAMYEAKRAGGACWRVFGRDGTGAGSVPSSRVTADAAGLARSELVEDQDSMG
jgi:hypothetical protein